MSASTSRQTRQRGKRWAPTITISSSDDEDERKVKLSESDDDIWVERTDAKIKRERSQTAIAPAKLPGPKNNRPKKKAVALKSGPRDLFSEMPLETLYQIAADLGLKELFHMSFVSKAFRAFIHSAPVEKMWTAMRATADVPYFYRPLSGGDKAMYGYLYGWWCQTCLAPTSNPLDPLLRVRLCTACQKLTLGKPPASPHMSIKNVIPVNAKGLCIKSYGKKIVDELNPLYDAGCTSLSTTGVDNVFAPRLAILIAQRRAQIEAKFIALGWQIEDFMHPAWIQHGEINIAKALTASEFSRLKPTLIQLLNKGRAARLEEQLHARRHDVMKVIATYYDSMKLSSKPFAQALFPVLGEFLEFQTVREQWETDDPVFDVEKWNKSLPQLRKDVSENTDKALKRLSDTVLERLFDLVQRTPLSLVRNISLSDHSVYHNHPSPATALTGVSVRFSCTHCRYAGPFPDFFLNHKCDGIYTDELGYPEELLNYQLDEVGVKNVWEMLELAGLKEDKATTADLDRLGDAFYCVGCTGRVYRTWEDMLKHAYQAPALLNRKAHRIAFEKRT
ncbi:F-box domain, cyclin-like domain containing protein [Pseudohyphozyma bogoriensis]|nr:F-box domain, cyclin-like domain containing protein [Pseudohyphozyma bogoriensis]